MVTSQIGTLGKHLRLRLLCLFRKFAVLEVLAVPLVRNESNQSSLDYNGRLDEYQFWLDMWVELVFLHSVII